MTIEEATKQAYDRGLEAGWQGVLMTLRPLFEAMLDADLDRWARGEPLDLTEEEVAFRTYLMTLLKRYCKTRKPYQPEGISYERVQNNGE